MGTQHFRVGLEHRFSANGYVDMDDYRSDFGAGARASYTHMPFSHATDRAHSDQQVDGARLDPKT